MPKALFKVYSDPSGSQTCTTSSNTKIKSVHGVDKENSDPTTSHKQAKGKLATKQGKQPILASIDKSVKISVHPRTAQSRSETIHTDGICTGKLVTRVLPAHVLYDTSAVREFKTKPGIEGTSSRPSVDSGYSASPDTDTLARRLTESPLAEVTEAYTGVGGFAVASPSQRLASSPLGSFSFSTEYSRFQSFLARGLDRLNDFLAAHPIAFATQLIVVSIIFFIVVGQKDVPQIVKDQASAADRLKPKPSTMPAFAPKEPVNLDPPKDDPFTSAQLAQYDGSDPSKPIYVAIKKKIYDVSGKRDMYGPGRGYNVFAGKDASRGLGKSSLKPEDAVAEWETSLTDEEKKVLDDWETYFSKRYNIVGKVVD